MVALTKKLQKRLDALKAAGGISPWSEAPKQHRQLTELGLVTEGRIGNDRYAVLVERTQGEDHVL